MLSRKRPSGELRNDLAASVWPGPSRVATRAPSPEPAAGPATVRSDVATSAVSAVPNVAARPTPRLPRHFRPPCTPRDMPPPLAASIVTILSRHGEDDDITPGHRAGGSRGGGWVRFGSSLLGN